MMMITTLASECRIDLAGADHLTYDDIDSDDDDDYDDDDDDNDEEIGIGM